MAELAILVSGEPIRVDTLSNKIYNVNGFLVEFEITTEANTEVKKFKFFNSWEFNRDLPSGYYQEDKALVYISYKQSTIFNPNISVPNARSMEDNYRFNFKHLIASKNDIINVDIYDYSKPNFISERLVASFKVEEFSSGNIKNYNNNGEIYIPLYGNEALISRSVLSEPTNNWLNSNDEIIRKAGYFYKRNFSDKLQNNVWSSLTNPEIEELDKYTTQISLYIVHIVKDLLPMLYNNVDETSFGDDLFSALFDIEHQWGMHYDFNDPVNTSYDSFLPETPDSELFKRKLSSIANFYYNIYRNQLTIQDLSPEETLKKLVRILPASALTLVSLKNRIDILEEFAKGRIPEDEENIILRILNSIGQEEANFFLNELLKRPGDGEITLLEGLYLGIEDKILWFGSDNRKEFMTKLYVLWFVSIFNPINTTNSFEFTPPPESGEPPLTYEQELINDLIEGQNDNYLTGNEEGYYSNTPAVIEYDSKMFFGFYIDNMRFSYQRKSIMIEQEKIQYEPYYNEYYIPKGNYHPYQPISLLDFKTTDIAASIPAIALEENNNGTNSAIIPIFFLKYIDDFGDTEDIWTGIGLTIEVALTFSGVGNLTKLRHLRHLSKLGKLIMNPSSFTQGERLLIIKTLSQASQGVAGTIELTAGFASLFLQYYSNGCSFYDTNVKNHINDNTPLNELKEIPNPPEYSTCSELENEPNPPEECKPFLRCKEMDRFLFWLQLGTAGMDQLAATMLRRSAKKIKDLGYPDHWEQSFKSTLDEIADVTSSYNTFINEIPVAFRTAVINKLELLAPGDDSFKHSFYEDFFPLVNEQNKLQFWDRTTANDSRAIENWKRFKDLDLPERLNLELLEDALLITKYETFFAAEELVPALKNLSLERRVEFMESFGEADQTFINKLIEKTNHEDYVGDPINRWANASGQTKLLAKEEPELWLYIADDLPEGTVYKPVGGNSVKHEFVGLDGTVHFRAKRLHTPPDEFSIEGLIKFKKKTFTEQQAIIDDVNNNVMDGIRRDSNPYRYTQEVSYQDSPIPRSNSGIGVAGDFKGAGFAFDPPSPPATSFRLGGSDVTDIPGLTEPLSNIIEKIKNFKNGVKVPIFNAERTVEYRTMWQKMGISPADGAKIKRKLKLEIHHVDDLDINLQTTVQLITKDAHLAIGSHTGSAKQIELLFEKINNLP